MIIPTFLPCFPFPLSHPASPRATVKGRLRYLTGNVLIRIKTHIQIFVFFLFLTVSFATLMTIKVSVTLVISLPNFLTFYIFLKDAQLLLSFSKLFQCVVFCLFCFVFLFAVSQSCRMVRSLDSWLLVWWINSFPSKGQRKVKNNVLQS